MNDADKAKLFDGLREALDGRGGECQRMHRFALDLVERWDEELSSPEAALDFGFAAALIVGIVYRARFKAPGMRRQQVDAVCAALEETAMRVPKPTLLTPQRH